jgi:hypothetical protein
MASNPNQSKDNFSIFTKRQNPTVKMSNEEEVTTTPEGSTYSKFVNKMKGVMKFGTVDEELQQQEIENQPFLTRWKNKTINALEVEKSYTNFFILLAVGLGIIMLGMVFFWMPTKFVSLITLGSCIIIISFIFIHGTRGLIEKLFSPERRIFTLIFLISMVLGFTTSFLTTGLIVPFIFAAAQFLILIFFVLTFIPGGSSGINFIISMISSPVMSLFAKIKGGS